MKKSTLPFFVFMVAPEGDGGTDEEVVEADETQEGEAETGDAETNEDEDGDESGSEQLGDAGKQALDRMKDKWKTERDRRRELEAKYEPPEPSEAAANNRFAQKILRAEIKAAAAGRFNDPADAYRFLNLEQFEVTEDGDVDSGEIETAIKSLLEEKPYLAKTQGERRNKGSADFGYRKDNRPTQLSRDDLSRMTPQQILAAEKEGRLKQLTGQ